MSIRATSLPAITGMLAFVASASLVLLDPAVDNAHPVTVVGHPATASASATGVGVPADSSSDVGLWVPPHPAAVMPKS